MRYFFRKAVVRTALCRACKRLVICGRGHICRGRAQ